MAVTFR